MSNLQSMNMNKKSSANVPCLLLNKEENDSLFRILGPRCQTQASAVVQVFVTEAPNYNSWMKKHCGVATFTKDNARKSYFIQVIDVMLESKLLEQEMYNYFTYHTSSNSFHQFEGDSGVIGFNFADEKEAEGFNNVIQERIAFKLKKKEERKRQFEHQNPNSQVGLSKYPSTPARSTSQSTTSLNQPLNISTSNLDKKSKNKKSRPKLTKDQIGLPTDFQHVTHVGFDPDHGFSQFNSDHPDDQLQDFFDMVGVGKRELEDDTTRSFIYNFIKNNGGIEQAKLESAKFQPRGLVPDDPTPPPRPHANHPLAPATPPTLPSRNLSTTRAPPPPPPRNQHFNSAPAVPSQSKLNGQARVVPMQRPKPPISVSTEAPPPPPPISTITQQHNTVAPPPPPPPPPPPSAKPIHDVAPPPPPPVPMNPHPTPASGGRGNLLKEIEQGISLKKVEATEKAAPTDSRTQLMKQIERGIQLKPVDEAQKNSYVPADEDCTANTMASMLMTALATRKAAINSSDSEDSGQTTTDDEWDDDE